MISKPDLQRLLQHEGTGKPILSLFLDMSVNSDNKRTYGVFLGQKRSQFEELQSDRASHHVEDVAPAPALGARRPLPATTAPVQARTPARTV